MARWPLRYAALPDPDYRLLTQLHIYVYIYFVTAPDSHSVSKPVRVPVTRVLHYVSNYFFWFLRHSDFEKIVGKRRTDGQTECNTSSPRYRCTLPARRRSKNVCLLLVLRAVQI